MTTVVEELKAKYGENTESFSIALLMEIHDRFGVDVLNHYVKTGVLNIN